MDKIIKGIIHLNYLIFKRPFEKRDPNKICLGSNNELPQNFKGIKYAIRGNNNKIIIHPSCNVNRLNITVFGNNNTCTIGEDCYLNEVSIWFEDGNGSIKIGNKSTFEQVLLACVESNTEISIGEDCMFSNAIELRTSDSHSIIDLKENKRINPAKNINIGNHVWVGGHVKILKGVTIGENSVVAMGALVTKNFGTNVLIGGVPANILKSQVTWNRERI